MDINKFYVWRKRNIGSSTISVIPSHNVTAYELFKDGSSKVLLIPTTVGTDVWKTYELSEVMDHKWTIRCIDSHPT